MRKKEEHLREAMGKDVEEEQEIYGGALEEPTPKKETKPQVRNQKNMLIYHWYKR